MGSMSSWKLGFSGVAFTAITEAKNKSVKTRNMVKILAYSRGKQASVIENKFFGIEKSPENIGQPFLFIPIRNSFGKVL